ncbi:MAG: DUF3102 domain-containing protein [Pirellulaceae bacterium]|nr:DUF3102 domain-containing protein [Pirellulaceae bacterium]
MDCTTITTEGQTDLTTLASEINREHRAATETAKSALEHARRCGELLSEAKGGCPHGAWLAWLESNFEGTPRLAQQYMRVADRWPEITANTKHVSHLSFREALRLTAEPKPAATTRDYFAGVDEDFAALIPELSPDRMLHGLDEHDRSYLVEVHPSREHPGYYHLLVYRNLDELDGPDGWVDFNSRPLKFTARMLAYFLDRQGIKPTIWGSKPAKKEVPWMIETGAERMERLCRRAKERPECTTP